MAHDDERKPKVGVAENRGYFGSIGASAKSIMEGMSITFAEMTRYLEGESIHARSLNLVGYLGRTLERSQFDREFRKYGDVLLWFAAIVGPMHALIHVAMIYHVASVFFFAMYAAQFALLLFVLWRYRQTGLMPTSRMRCGSRALAGSPGRESNVPVLGKPASTSSVCPLGVTRRVDCPPSTSMK